MDNLNVEVLMSELLHMDSSNLDISISDIVYQRFNPREFLLMTDRMAKAEKLSREVNKKNLVLLGLVCALKGSKINKIIRFSGFTRELKDRLSNLRVLYSITDGRPSSPITATLPRFLAVTALPVSMIIHKYLGDQITLPLNPSEVSQDYPLEFCMWHAGALLPANVSPNDMITKAVAYGQYLMTLKFRGKATKGQVLQSVLIAAKSNLWTVEHKIAHLNKLRILHGGNIAPRYEASLSEAARKFDALP